MNELVFVIPQFIAAGLFAWIAFQFSTEQNDNVVLQMLFFILMFGFLLSGFANMNELAVIQETADAGYSPVQDISAMTYGISVFGTMASLLLLMVFILKGYFVMANSAMTGEKPKWDRVNHEYLK